jgi:ankyrin repeat protein
MQKSKRLPRNAQAKEPIKFKASIMPSGKLALSAEEQSRLNDELFANALNGNNANVTRFLKAGADIKAKGNDGQTVLHYAACFGHTDVCALLIQEYAKADGDVKQLITAKDTEGLTVLHYAAANIDTRTCALLIKEYAKAGGDIKGIIKAKNNAGETAHGFAVTWQHPQTARFLLESGVRALIGKECGKLFVSLFRECIG